MTNSQSDPARHQPRTPVPMEATASDTQAAIQNVRHTRTRATFVFTVIGAIILILLLVFILLNLKSQDVNLIFGTVSLPVGVSLLIAAVAGALITALAGGARLIQVNRTLKKVGKDA